MQFNEKTIFRCLTLGFFPSVLAEQVQRKQCIDDPYCFEAMDHVRELNLSHPEIPKETFEHDVVLCLYRRRSYRPDYQYEHTTVSIEIKTHLDDLIGDRKIDQYIGATSWLFIAVPETLITAAVAKIRENPSTMKYKGLINAETGEIVIMPQEQRDFSRERCTRLHGQMHASKKRMPWYDVEGLYQLHNNSINPIPKPTWKRIDGMKVNDSYVELVLSEKELGYSLDNYRRVDAMEKKLARKHKRICK